MVNRSYFVYRNNLADIGTAKMKHIAIQFFGDSLAWLSENLISSVLVDALDKLS